MPTRIALIALAALLALPLTQTASPVDAKKRGRSVTMTFRNATPLALPTAESISPVSASVYPSAIEVDGLKRGRIRDVDVRLLGFGHAAPEQVDVLLVGPRGQTAVLMADVGGPTDVTDVTLRLDDDAAASLPDQTELRSGAFRPTNQEGLLPFIEPAPVVGENANAALSVFDGSNPNGTWLVFVQDGFAEVDTGAIAGGWELEITVKAKKKR